MMLDSDCASFHVQYDIDPPVTLNSCSTILMILIVQLKNQDSSRHQLKCIQLENIQDFDVNASNSYINSKV